LPSGEAPKSSEPVQQKVNEFNSTVRRRTIKFAQSFLEEEKRQQILEVNKEMSLQETQEVAEIASERLTVEDALEGVKFGGKTEKARVVVVDGNASVRQRAKAERALGVDGVLVGADKLVAELLAGKTSAVMNYLDCLEIVERQKVVDEMNTLLQQAKP
jgi:hypothetical protein